MEQKNSNVVTFDDLARFTEEVLLPGIEQIVDDKLESKFNEKLAPVYKEMSDMRDEFRANFADVQSELRAIRSDIANLQDRVARLENMVKDDLKAFGGDIVEIKKELKCLEMRVSAIEV